MLAGGAADPGGWVGVAAALLLPGAGGVLAAVQPSSGMREWT